MASRGDIFSDKSCFAIIAFVRRATVHPRLRDDVPSESNDTTRLGSALPCPSRLDTMRHDIFSPLLPFCPILSRATWPSRFASGEIKRRATANSSAGSRRRGSALDGQIRGKRFDEDECLERGEEKRKQKKEPAT